MEKYCVCLQFLFVNFLYTSNNQRLVKCVRLVFSHKGWLCIVLLDRSTGTSMYKQSRNWVENCLFDHLLKPWSLALKATQLSLSDHVQ